MINHNHILLIVLINFFCIAEGVTQQKSNDAAGDKSEAKDNFEFGNWNAAIKEYEGLLTTESNNPKYLYRLGVCYLETYHDRDQAINYFQQAIKAGCKEKDVRFMLGKAYHLASNFNKAIEEYKNARNASSNEALNKQAQRYIEMCLNAKDLIKNPLNVTIENLGPYVNSDGPDYYPFVTEDESELIFTTRRIKGNQGYDVGDGWFTADIFLAKDKKGVWYKSRNIGGMIGTLADEECVGRSADGKHMFINHVNYGTEGEIMWSTKRGKTPQRAILIDDPVNSDFIEITAHISKDEQTLFFCSDRIGGFGGSDIYMTKKLPDGGWGEPVNLGENINTEYDEYFPNLSEDETTLYFSSEGHTSMGGFDIFVCQWEKGINNWGRAENFGYPINTVNDDMQISFIKGGRKAYKSGVYDMTHGDLDIYSIIFPEVEERNALITGIITTNVPIDYNIYQEFHYYKKGETQKRFVEEFLPKDDTWKFVKKEKLIVKPGYQYKVYIKMMKGGEEKTFSADKAPLTNPAYTFKEAKIRMLPIKNYKAPSKSSRPKTTKVKVPEVIISVENMAGEEVGVYSPNPKTAKYVIILPEGEYTMMVDAEGYQPITSKIKVIGKSSFRPVTIRHLNLEPLTPHDKVHFSKLLKKKENRN